MTFAFTNFSMLGALINPSFILFFIFSSVFFFTTVFLLPQQSILAYAFVLFLGIFTVPRLFYYFSIFFFDFDSISSDDLLIYSSDFTGMIDVWLFI
jgi:hypothetical protein